FAVCPAPIQVKRVVVTDVISHQNIGDLFGSMNHSRVNVVLNSHSGQGPVTSQPFVYDDSGRKDFANARHTDGAGALTDYGGGQGAGQWLMTQVDNTPGNAGTNVALSIFLERQQDPLDGVTVTLAPGECTTDFLYVPVEATNLTVRGTLITP